MSPFMKYRLLALTFLSLAISSMGQDKSLRVVSATFEKFQDAHLTFNPTSLLEVILPQTSGPPVEVKAAIHLPRNETAGPPIFAIQSTGSDSGLPYPGPFVIAMVDLDAPSPEMPTRAQIRHFLGGNFHLGRPDAHGLALLTNSTPALTEFRQPTPTEGTHRYVLLLFHQSKDFDTQTEVNATTSAMNFNISQFALDVGLGNPLGGTFMLVTANSTA